jgi:hypothetical protein
MNQPTTMNKRHIQALRRRLEAVRRRQSSTQHRAHPFAMRRLEKNRVAHEVEEHDD